MVVRALALIHVEQHDDEQEQHHHRASVDQDLQNRQEVGLQQHEQRGRTDKGYNHTQRAVDRIRTHNHEQGGDQRDRCKHVKENV